MPPLPPNTIKNQTAPNSEENVQVSSVAQVSVPATYCAPKFLRQPKVSTLFGNPKITKKTACEIDKKLLLLFIFDFQPFSVVQDSGFQSFVASLNPSYQLPSRQSISKTAIPALYEECQHKIKELIKHGIKFCITTDCWTSRNTVSYIAVTAHFLDNNFNLYTVLLQCRSIDVSHTSDNLALLLSDIVQSWGIQDQILLAVSDNAINIKNAIKVKLNWNYFGCFAHTLNLIVKDGLKTEEISKILNKIKQIVRHFKKSSKSNAKLMAYQRNVGKEPLKLLQEVETRWNSTLYMLQRLILLEDAVKSTIALIDKQLPSISQREWLIIKNLCLILKPFDDATQNVSGESYCSGSIVIPIANGLISVYSNIKASEYPYEITQFITKVKFGIVDRLRNIEENETLAMSTFLDPRFKTFAFSNPTCAEHIKEIVTNSISLLYNWQANTAEKEIVDNAIPNELSIWNSFDSHITHFKPRGTTTSRAIIEVQRYLEDDLISRNEDILKWWRINKIKYPKLSQIAQEKLCALGSSVPCERIFSKAGQVLNERRTRLSDNKTKMLLFLNTNYKYM